MQQTYRYLANNRVAILANLDGFITEYRPVYQKQLNVYRGIDNLLHFEVKNHDQKPVSLAGYTPKFMMFDENNNLVVEHNGTVTDDVISRTTSGVETAADATLTFTSTSGIAVGQTVTGLNIKRNTLVSSVVGNEVTLNKSASAAVTAGTSITFQTQNQKGVFTVNLTENDLLNLKQQYAKYAKLKPKISCLNVFAPFSILIAIFIIVPSIVYQLIPFLLRLIRVDTFLVQNNRLTQISDSIGSMTSLVTLDLSENSLTSLPEETTACNQLSSLSLHHNAFEELPACISALTALTNLTLNNCHLKDGFVDNFFENLTELRRLDLSCNKIVQIPMSLYTLGQLRYLNLETNAVASLAMEVNGLMSLQELYMQVRHWSKVYTECRIILPILYLPSVLIY